MKFKVNEKVVVSPFKNRGLSLVQRGDFNWKDITQTNPAVIVDVMTGGWANTLPYRVRLSIPQGAGLRPRVYHLWCNAKELTLYEKKQIQLELF